MIGYYIFMLALAIGFCGLLILSYFEYKHKTKLEKEERAKRLDKLTGISKALEKIFEIKEVDDND